MKQLLTAAQVTANLQTLFAGKQITCTETYDDRNKPYFYIETKRTKIVVVGKMVWIKPTIKEWADYLIYCNDFNPRNGQRVMYQKIRTLVGTCIPFQYLKKKDKEATEHANLLLQACGMKSARKQDSATDDINRLREFKCSSLIDIYKVIKEVTVIDSNLEYQQVYEGYGKYRDGNLMLAVTHKTGDFKFQIDCITGYKDQDEQIQNIFLNLLGKPVTSKQELVAA